MSQMSFVVQTKINLKKEAWIIFASFFTGADVFLTSDEKPRRLTLPTQEALNDLCMQLVIMHCGARDTMVLSRRADNTNKQANYPGNNLSP